MQADLGSVSHGIRIFGLKEDSRLAEHAGAEHYLTVTPFVMTMSGMRTEKIEVRVEPEEPAAFVAAAKAEGLSLSAWIRRLLLIQLKKPGS